ncbi:hypothetical protein ACXX9E_29525 [Pseudomonas sp. GNP014]
MSMPWRLSNMMSNKLDLKSRQFRQTNLPRPAGIFGIAATQRRRLVDAMSIICQRLRRRRTAWPSRTEGLRAAKIFVYDPPV